MERDSKPTTGGRALRFQEFNGKTYKLYAGERYFSRGCHRMHRDVWEFYNGPIPKGYEVHHKDGNPENNDIANLVCIPHGEHAKEHHEEHVARGLSAKGQANIHKAMEAAREWHGSDAGHDWHSEHARKQAAAREWRDAVCECCGKSFRYRSIQTPRFCSNACKSKWRRDTGADNVVRICAFCGREFSTNRFKDAITCGPSCASKYRWKVRRDGGSL